MKIRQTYTKLIKLQLQQLRKPAKNKNKTIYLLQTKNEPETSKTTKICHKNWKPTKSLISFSKHQKQSQTSKITMQEILERIPQYVETYRNLKPTHLETTGHYMKLKPTKNPNTVAHLVQTALKPIIETPNSLSNKYQTA